MRVDLDWRKVTGWCLLVMGLLTTGCRAGNEPTLEAYFQDLVRVVAPETEQRSMELQAELEELEENAPDVVVIGAVRAFVEGSVPLGREVLDGLRELQPPEEAREAHDRMVAAFERVIEAYEDVAQGLRFARTKQEAADMLFWGTAGATASLESACHELQGIARDNGIAVELDCAGLAAV